MKTNISLLIFLFMLNFISAKGQDANQILKKVDNTILAVKDKKADVVMEMTNTSTGKGNIKKAVIMQKGAEKKIFRYTYPKSDKGIATLTLPDAVYLYLPMFKKPKKITNMAQSKTFNKSDFSLSDAGLMPYAKHFDSKLLKTTATDYILELSPKQEPDQYSRLVMTVNKKHFYPDKIEFYDKNGALLKEGVYIYKNIGKYWVVEKATMKNVKKGHKTTLTMSNIKINQGLKDSDFTVEKLAPPKNK